MSPGVGPSVVLKSPLRPPPPSRRTSRKYLIKDQHGRGSPGWSERLQAPAHVTRSADAAGVQRQDHPDVGISGRGIAQETVAASWGRGGKSAVPFPWLVSSNGKGSGMSGLLLVRGPDRCWACLTCTLSTRSDASEKANTAST